LILPHIRYVLMLFTARQHSLVAMQSTVLATVNMSVCLSVRPSNAGTVSKQLRSCGLHWRI